MKPFYKMIMPVLFILNCMYTATAQTGPILQPMHELSIGDQCPDFEFNNIINWTKPAARLSDFKGKLVILDFWATWCGPCVHDWPKMDSLQRLFAGKIVILPVTIQKENIASDFFRTSQFAKNTILPSVTENTVLNQYFPHSFIPHEVWINGNGQVIAITHDDDVNAANIELSLSKGNLKVDTKKDHLNLFSKSNIHKSLLNGGFGDDYVFDLKDLKYNSALIDYVPGSGGLANGTFDTVGDLLKFRAINCPIQILYKQAFMIRPNVIKSANPDFYLGQSARTILEVRDSSLFMWPGKKREPVSEMLRKGRAFCYEFFFPKSDAASANGFMVDDLNRYFGHMFGIKGVLEKRRVKCWALVRTDGTGSLESQGGDPEIYFSKNRDTMKMQNMPLKEMMYDFVSYYMYPVTLPVIDETAYSGNVDIEIDAKLADPIAVSKELEKYGLAFKLVERDLDMIVIKQTGEIKKSD